MTRIALPPYASVWVRDHSIHTPAHRITARRTATLVELACSGTVEGGRTLPPADAIRQRVTWCRRCWDLPLPRVTDRFGAAS
jgi:hypothetical protein